jgi:hypothetical protein
VPADETVAQATPVESSATAVAVLHRSSTHSLLPIPERPMNSRPTPYTSARLPWMDVDGAKASSRYGLMR